jgi:hypothetical protein
VWGFACIPLSYLRRGTQEDSVVGLGFYRRSSRRMFEPGLWKVPVWILTFFFALGLCFVHWIGSLKEASQKISSLVGVFYLNSPSICYTILSSNILPHTEASGRSRVLRLPDLEWQHHTRRRRTCMRAIQRLKLRPVRPSDVFRLSKDRRLIRRLVVSPLPIEVQPGEGVISATSFESRCGRVVGVCVGVEYRVP